MPASRISRNAPCPCGSGKKYKHCCLPFERQGRREQSDSVRHQPSLAEMRRIAGADLTFVSPEQLQRIQRLQELSQEMAAFEAMRDQIDAAARTLELHRVEYEALLNDPVAAQERIHQLFSEERFHALRFTALDIHRAFQAVGYPQRYRHDPTPDSETFRAAIVHLADSDRRHHLARGLLMRLPPYVSAGRYPDGWLIEHFAVHLIQEPDASNPFLLEMFDYGLAEWAQQVDVQQDALLDQVGLDRSTVAGLDIDQVEAWLRDHMSDPDAEARLEAYYAVHPLMSDQAEAELQELERDVLHLFERDDADRLHLTSQELDPWLPMLEERLTPLGASARAAAEHGELDQVNFSQAAARILLEIAIQMVPDIFTPPRLQQLLSDVRDYRRTLLESKAGEAAMYAHTALTLLEREDTPAENPFLITLCFASLRAWLASLSQHSQVIDTEDVSHTGHPAD